MESEVAPEKWEELSREHPVLRQIVPDVEALLVWGSIGAAALECFVAPVDACYELSGLCRTHWRLGGSNPRLALRLCHSRRARHHHIPYAGRLHPRLAADDNSQFRDAGDGSRIPVFIDVEMSRDLRSRNHLVALWVQESTLDLEFGDFRSHQTANRVFDAPSSLWQPLS